MKKILAFLFAATLMAGLFTSCSKDTTTNNPTPVINLTGHWIGSQSYMGVLTVKLDLNLTDVAGVLGGTGKVTYTPVLGSPSDIDIPIIVGTFKNPDVNLTLAVISYSGKLSSDQKQIVGNTTIPANTYTGNVPITVAITLIKQ